MRIELWRHSKISVHHGKTKLWNKAGILPSGVGELQQLASSVDEESCGEVTHSCRRPGKESRSSASPPFLTSRQHGCCCLTVPPLVPILCCALCDQSWTENPVSHDAAIRKCFTTILGVQASAVPELTHRTVSLLSLEEASVCRAHQGHTPRRIGGWVGNGPETQS